jgi:small subunit ribosomal protein S19
MPRKFTYRGITLEELRNLSLEKLVELLPTRARRSIKRGLPPAHRTFYEKLKKYKRKKRKKLIKTHCRDLIILPDMVGLRIGIYNGKEFKPVDIKPEMIGHYLGEFALTRKRVVHSAPGVGATKSSLYVPLK